MPVIRVKEGTWEMMKALAKPFEKPDELIARAITALAEKVGGNLVTVLAPMAVPQPRNGGKSTRDGDGITRQEYKDLIIECLEEVGGSAEKQHVERWIAARLGDRLKPYHWAPLKNEIRWKKDVQFCRNALREAGVIKAGSPEGVWELASAGRRSACPTARKP